MTRYILLAVFVLADLAHSQQTPITSKNPFRMWIQPQLGFASENPGAGLEVNAAYGHFIAGLRAQGSGNLCLFCTEVNRNQQSAMLGAIIGGNDGNSISILSGITQFSGNKRGKYEPDDGFMTWGDGYEQIHYDGIDVPVELNLIFGGKHSGFGITTVVDFSHDNPSAGIFLGVPFGSLAG